MILVDLLSRYGALVPLGFSCLWLCSHCHVGAAASDKRARRCLVVASGKEHLVALGFEVDLMTVVTMQGLGVGFGQSEMSFRLLQRILEWVEKKSMEVPWVCLDMARLLCRCARSLDNLEHRVSPGPYASFMYASCISHDSAMEKSTGW